MEHISIDIQLNSNELCLLKGATLTQIRIWPVVIFVDLLVYFGKEIVISWFYLEQIKLNNLVTVPPFLRHAYFFLNRNDLLSNNENILYYSYPTVNEIHVCINKNIH